MQGINVILFYSKLTLRVNFNEEIISCDSNIDA